MRDLRHRAVAGLGVVATALLTLYARPSSPDPVAPAEMAWIAEEDGAGFWIDINEVTNADFRAFVEATRYVTVAERAPDLGAIMAQVPQGTPPPSDELLVPGSLVFQNPEGSVDLHEPGRWWAWTPGANWRHPDGPRSTIEGRDDHPVIHVAWEDAVAYAAWAGKRLPSEAEWMRAALAGAKDPALLSSPRASDIEGNIWHGAFPRLDHARDGFDGTAPVGSFPPNAAGLHDMAGNVWEWCSDEVPAADGMRGSWRVIKGGSYLCAENYCRGWRVEALQAVAPDSGSSHVGFRCAMDATGPPHPDLHGTD
jgi:formylglycine-generating enzyme